MRAGAASSATINGRDDATGADLNSLWRRVGVRERHRARRQDTSASAAGAGIDIWDEHKRRKTGPTSSTETARARTRRCANPSEGRPNVADSADQGREGADKTPSTRRRELAGKVAGSRKALASVFPEHTNSEVHPWTRK